MGVNVQHGCAGLSMVYTGTLATKAFFRANAAAIKNAVYMRGRCLNKGHGDGITMPHSGHAGAAKSRTADAQESFYRGRPAAFRPS